MGAALSTAKIDLTGEGCGLGTNAQQELKSSFERARGDALTLLQPATAPSLTARWGWLWLGILLQVGVYALDQLTAQGFAHGVLYAAPVILGLLARSHRAVWLLAAIGVAGGLLGSGIGGPPVRELDGTFIVFNRAVGVGTVLLVGTFSSAMLHVLRLRRAAYAAVERGASLLAVSSHVGQLGGWRVELPSRVVHWSPEVFRLLEQSGETPPGLELIFERYAPEHRASIREAFEACAGEGVAFDLDAQLLQASGGRRWVRVVGQAVRDLRGQIVRAEGAIQDIESSKQAALALARSQAEWQELAESLPMMVWVGEDDGTLSFMNRFSAEYVGTTVASLLGSGWVEHVHPDYQQATLDAWSAARAGAFTYEAEFPVLRADGTWRLHMARAVRVELPEVGHRWYGTAIDVQALYDERDARAHLSNRLAETMESVTDAIFILDQDWKMVYLNGQAERQLERRREELLGRNVWDEFPGARGSEFQRQYERCMSERATVSFEASYAPLGKLFDVTAYPADGGLMVYFRDVTEAKRVAEQLHQSQRMDSLGQLTGGVAHDFNNLLTVILGNAESLAEDAAANARQRMMADMIAAAATRGAEMTQRLLAFARKQALAPRPTDVNRLVRQFAPLLERSLGEHVEMEMVYAAGLWQSLVDPGQLEVALLNLVVNARDAMPSGGRLTIETSNAWLDDAYAARSSEVLSGQYVMVAVSDTGHGIASDVLPRVFEPFFTTKEIGKGTGMGLAMVYGFAKQSQGHVTIYSEIDRGTTVRLYLPRLLHTEQPQSDHAEAPAVAGGAGELVLLVEDDEMVRAFARQQVEALGYRVVDAGNGPEALQRLEAHPDVGVLFTDVVMPGGMSGRELADAARNVRPGLPVLYTSGYTENAIVHHGRLDAGVLLLPKPYLRRNLADKLRQALGH